MRRPSWNKSQAIQQVISLKALLESDDDTGARETLRKILATAAVVADENQPRANSNSGGLGKELSAAANAPESVEEIVPYQHRDPPQMMPLDASSSPTETDKRAASPRTGCASEDSVGQMTIFYRGQVNVYTVVSPEKAESIMQLAATPVHFLQDDFLNGTSSVCGGLSEQKSLAAKVSQEAKRQGRFKVRKDAGPVSSNREIYQNHQIRTPIPNGQFRKSSSISSPPQPGVAHGTNLGSLSVHLNEEGI